MWKICMCGAGNLPTKWASRVSCKVQLWWEIESKLLQDTRVEPYSGQNCDNMTSLTISWDLSSGETLHFPNLRTLGAVPSRCNVTDLFFSTANVNHAASLCLSQSYIWPFVWLWIFTQGHGKCVWKDDLNDDDHDIPNGCHFEWQYTTPGRLHEFWGVL